MKDFLLLEDSWKMSLIRSYRQVIREVTNQNSFDAQGVNLLTENDVIGDN